MGGMAKQACKDYLNARATMRIELKNQPPDSQGDPMTLKKKLFACLAALAMATTFVSVLSLWQMNHGRVALQSILKDQVEPMSDLKIVGDKYAVDIVDASHKAHAGTISFAEAAQTVSAGAKAIDANWRRYKDTKIEGEEALLAEEAEAEMRVADANVAELEQILRRGDREALDSFVENKLYQSIDPVSGTVGDLVTLQIANAEKTAAGASATALLSRNVTIGLVALALLVFVISLSIVSSKVIAPVRALADTIRGLAAQKGSAQVPHLDQQDEIGDIARSVETFRQAVVHAEQEKALAASHATETLGEGLSALASGDLTYQLEGDFPEAYEKLKTDFNETAEALRTTLSQLTLAATGINDGASDIRQASDDLSLRTEQQAASLEETAAALEQITGTVASTAAKSKSANSAVRTARDEAERSGETVRSAVEAMGSIERTSNEIVEIISVIDGIAFQTNLLALNAGVEAARAGDAGQGFAVVASEVRALAQRSAAAATDVKARITASSSQVENGVELVGETGKALETIIARIAEVDGLVSEIADAADQQSTGLRQINTAVGEMDGVTQQNAAMVEQATAAARSLAEEVQNMSQQIGRFRVQKNGANVRALPVAANKVQSQPQQQFQTRRPAAAAPQVVGNTALAVDEDDWSEF